MKNRFAAGFTMLLDARRFLHGLVTRYTRH